MFRLDSGLICSWYMLPWNDKRQYLEKVQTEINAKTFKSSSRRKGLCINNHLLLENMHLIEVYKVSKRNQSIVSIYGYFVDTVFCHSKSAKNKKIKRQYVPYFQILALISKSSIKISNYIQILHHWWYLEVSLCSLCVCFHTYCLLSFHFIKIFNSCVRSFQIDLKRFSNRRTFVIS